MNITVHTPLDDDRVVERRRCTHAGVSGLTIELADGTTFEVNEDAGMLVVATPNTQQRLTLNRCWDWAVQISAARYGNEEQALMPTHLTDEQYALLLLQLSALGQRTDLVLTPQQRDTLVHLLEQAAENVRVARIPRWLAPDGTYRSDEETQ